MTRQSCRRTLTSLALGLVPRPPSSRHIRLMGTLLQAITGFLGTILSMVALVSTYYLLVYDPVTSVWDRDDGNADLMPDGRRREANPIDTAFHGFFRPYSNQWYTMKLAISDRNALEKEFNNVRVHYCCF